MQKAIARVINLIAPDSQQLFDLNLEEANARLLSGREEEALGIGGSFALLVRDGERVIMARSLDRPMRYFLAKEVDGPMLVVAERIDEIRRCLEEQGHGDQFHPSYTRMVPAHHVTTLRLVGCPDPNPEHRRFFAPAMATHAADPESIGKAYMQALFAQVRRWLQTVPTDEPIGVLFSGGADSGAVLLATYHQMLDLGMSPSRLKAFTLSVEGGSDLEQARDFLRRTELEMLGEIIEAKASDLDPLAAVEVIEDYKPRDVECATVGLALLAGIRRRYPEWRYLIDGDGGDENLKDYPIEENPELTIRSVVNNSMLYQEGWGVDKIKHSLTYSGGMSRGCVRTFAPSRRFDFRGFSPFTTPEVIRQAEAIPFRELTQGDHEKLYALKGQITRAGIHQLTGIDMPVFPKCRFQHGALAEDLVASSFGDDEARYRSHFLALHNR